MAQGNNGLSSGNRTALRRTRTKSMTTTQASEIRAGGKAARTTYYDFVKEAAKPISERKATVEGRNGMRQIRRHHLDEASQAALLKKISSGGFVSPYKRDGGYWGVTQALALLGPNEYHPIADVMKKMREVMDTPESRNKAGKTAWDRFAGKNPRSRKNGLDFYGRIIQNCTVLQRIGGDDPYGLKLVQVGACLDMKADEHKSPMVCLRVGIPKGEPVIPVNQIKTRQCRKSIESVPSQIVFPDVPGMSKRSRRLVSGDEEPAEGSLAGGVGAAA